MNKYLKLVIDAGLMSLDVAEQSGCSPEEIEEVRKIWGEIPNEYAIFLAGIGKCAGSFLVGSSVFYPEVLQLRNYAREWRNEMGGIPEDAIVFLMHQGYEASYFLRDSGDNPPVFYILEPNEIRPDADSFYEYFEKRIAESVENQKKLEALRLQNNRRE